MSARTYTVGVPACITVADDGSVEFSIDLSEANDLYLDESADYPDAWIEADAERVSGAAATMNNYLTRVVTP